MTKTRPTLRLRRSLHSAEGLRTANAPRHGSNRASPKPDAKTAARTPKVASSALLGRASAKRAHGRNQPGYIGWTFTGIATFESGLPFSVEDGFDRANTMQSSVPPDASERPDLKPGFSNNPVLGNPNEWFNPNAFELQPAGAFGDLGRDTVRGPGLADLDMGFLKAFKITEERILQFRFEAFNIFNHANFAVPNFEDRYLYTADALTGAISANPLVGRITSTVTSSRQLQFALRFEF